ncbi:MAG: arylamine N-acetyltransferase [Anaerolineales bacterium]
MRNTNFIPFTGVVVDIRNYLNRIGFDGPVRLDVETLFGLHRTHLLTVPFENLDIHLEKPIELDEQALWRKIVLQGRGGFCYELNGMFAWLLRQIGFDVNYLNGRVYNHAGKRGREFDHLTLRVNIPGEAFSWLADVGFGDSFFEPLMFDFIGEQVQGSRAYRLENVKDGIDLLRREHNGNWSPQYFFDLQARTFPGDYQASCNYHQTSPKSSFTRERVVSLATPDGRITLDSNNLTLTTNGKRIKRPLNGEQEFREFLKYYFEIEL